MEWRTVGAPLRAAVEMRPTGTAGKCIRNTLFGGIKEEEQKSTVSMLDPRSFGDLRGRGVEILGRRSEREAKTLVNSELDRCLERSNLRRLLNF